MASSHRKHGVLRGAAGASLFGAAAWIGYSQMFVRHDLPLPPALFGDRLEFTGRAGRLSYYTAGVGQPILLLHSINAAGSAFEVRPIYERLRSRYRVYALDLPGFGFSDRSDREYTIRLYVDAVHDILDVIARDNGDAPIDALALSLSSEFLARAVSERPGKVRSLSLVNPTGFMRGADKLRDAPESTREVPGLYGMFTFPLWSQAFYDLLVSKRSIRYFLQRTYGSKDIDEDMVEYDYLSTHQPGAKNAPYAFVSGRLFSKDIRSVYEKLSLPVWVPHGTRGDFKDFSESGWAKARPNWTFSVFETGALPHFEKPEAFMTSMERYLAATSGGEAGHRPGSLQPGSSAAASAP